MSWGHLNGICMSTLKSHLKSSYWGKGYWKFELAAFDKVYPTTVRIKKWWINAIHWLYTVLTYTFQDRFDIPMNNWNQSNPSSADKVSKNSVLDPYCGALFDGYDVLCVARKMMLWQLSLGLSYKHQEDELSTRSLSILHPAQFGCKPRDGSNLQTRWLQ